MQLDLFKKQFGKIMFGVVEGETIFSPFGGIGSEGFCALKMNRKSISIELKESYFQLNAKNHKDCISEKESVLTLF